VRETFVAPKKHAQRRKRRRRRPGGDLHIPLLVKILGAPVYLPMKLVMDISRELHQHAERAVTDEGAVREKLLELQVLYELDEIDEAEYERREAELMARLREIREAQRSASDEEVDEE